MIPAFYIHHPMGLAVAAGLGLVLLFGWLPRFAERRMRADIVLRSAQWRKVYILQDVSSPSLIKVGITKRAFGTRMREISDDMTGGRELRQLYMVHLPYADAVEQEAHRLLRRWQRRSERGTEWFRLSDPQRAVDAVNRASTEVRRVARRRHLWSREADRDATVWVPDDEGWAIERLFS